MALSHITQTGSEDYVGHFIQFSCRTPDWSDAQLLGAFLEGLKDELQDDVVASGPSSLARAIELARIYEHKQGRRPSSCSGFNRSFASSAKPISSSSFPPSTQPPSTWPLPPPPSTPSHKPILRFTQAEMRARREKGLCFNCDEQYRPGHRCRQSHVFLLLADDGCSDPDLDSDASLTQPSVLVEQPDHPIALNAISVTKRSRDHADQGFLNPQVATRLGLPIDATSIEPVMRLSLPSY
ncbi:hypothetical protein ACFX12_030902 [Malus domestica]